MKDGSERWKKHSHLILLVCSVAFHVEQVMLRTKLMSQHYSGEWGVYATTKLRGDVQGLSSSENPPPAALTLWRHKTSQVLLLFN